jgi:hypothetical protein
MRAAHPYRHVALASPVSAALAGFVAFLGLFAVAPIRVSQDFSALGPLFAGGMYAMFVLGVVSYRMAGQLSSHSKGQGSGKPPKSAYQTERLFWILFVIAWLAELAWLVDRFYFRAVPIDADPLERREALESTTSTPLSVIAAVLCPASFLIWHVALMLREHGHLSAWKFSLMFITFWAPALNVVLLGSRSTALIALAYVIVLAAYHARERVRWLGVSALLVVFGLAVVFFVQTILYRLSLVGLSGLFSIENSVYAFTLQPKPFLVEALSVEESGFWESALFASSNIAQYYCHGLFELFYQVDHFSGYQHSLGTNTFFVPYKFLTLLFPLPDALEMMASARPHYGTFGSFFGPLHSDFGWLATFVMFAFGWLAAWFQRIARADAAWVPLYALSLATVFLFPVANMLVIGVGFYLFSGFIIFGLMTSEPVRKSAAPT